MTSHARVVSTVSRRAPASLVGWLAQHYATASPVLVLAAVLATAVGTFAVVRVTAWRTIASSSWRTSDGLGSSSRADHPTRGASPRRSRGRHAAAPAGGHSGFV